MVDNHFVPHNYLHHHSAFIAPAHTYSYEDPYLRAATNNINGYYYPQTSEYIDDVFVTDDASLFRTNMQNRHPSQAHNHRQVPPNHYRNSRNSTGDHLAPHTNSVFPYTYSYLWDPYYYQPTIELVDDAYVTTDVHHLIETMRILDRNFGSRLNELPFDYTAFLDLGDDDTQVVDQEENIIMLKTRSHCAKVEVTNSEGTVLGADDREEICAICLCEYENDETIGTLDCRHEYHAGCIEQWLLKGKQNCPICRSSVLPS
ncbi:brassinosteroid-responsive RING protein 1-like [Lycium barbarum]|uniref:brassinosteroid-responsive RING protein 1-like n=1 Tax=Lycium barbarum TaxID=112863 RepID=UPI00293EF88E|nr:brassinosteroid-responsive RING protein 1-like [Lycium barbarum]